MSTRSGWIGDVEVVEVLFNPDVVTFAELLKHGHARDCARQVFARSEAQHDIAKATFGDLVVLSDAAVRTAKDDKYHLRQSALRYVPMTATQATRCNADVGRAHDWLAPFQLALLDAATAEGTTGWPVAIGAPLDAGLAALEKARARTR